MKNPPMKKPDHISQEDWDEVCDNPELTEEELADVRPPEEVLPPEVLAFVREKQRQIEEGRRRGGRPTSPARKQPVSLRLDRDLVERLRATGPGWQRRVNDMLRKAVGL